MLERRVRRGRLVAVWLIPTLALAMAACGAAGAAQPPRAAVAPPAPATVAQPPANAPGLKKVSLVLDWLVSGEYAPIYLADQEGLFRKQGLEVSIVPGKGSAVAVAQVANGDYTFGLADAAVVMQYVSKGSPVEMVFDMARQSANAVIYPARSPIHSPKDLEGRSIAFTPGGAAPTLLPVFLKLAHVDAAKVKLVSVQASQRDSLLLTHKVDAIDSTYTTEHGLLLGQGMSTKWFTYASVGLNLPYYGIVVDKTMLASHPATIRAFLRAISQGMADTERDPQAAVQAVKTISKSPDFNIASNLTVLKDNMTLWDTASSRGKPLGWMPPQDWSSAAKTLEEYMHLKPFDVQSAYTNAYVPPLAS